MAELLVRAKPHWQDEWDATKVASLTLQELRSYNARSQIGDIIVVRPDGWLWGREECLPNYVVIKIPDLKIEDAKKYEESLQDTTDKEKSILLKVRKYQIPKTIIDNAKRISQSFVNVEKLQTTIFISNIIEKVI